ncbi:hypothetical protein [Winogradskyella sp. PG-2]|uniref:hypothetical protein n=1 Tax=Winogradskyella sp. PG-2 TaxID=754409 RepID=UPI0004587982|nr:hypothetical protein [Winogradskyella sp. PG-2]BAO74482.1 hypothetical protein WPG_0252 [Winogradskyella sp. PG-2]
MNKILTYLLIFCIGLCYSQEKNITIDYTVDYLVPKKNKTEVDTITIGFDKDGRYLWTDSEYLAKDLGRSMFRGKEELLKDAEIGIILDTEKLKITLFFSSGDNEIYMNVALDAIVPIRNSNKPSETFELQSETTGDTIKVLDRETEMYILFPSNKPDDSVYVGVDKELKVDNTKLFDNFLSFFFAAEENSEMKALNFPNGLILNISDDGKTIIEAHKINTNTKTITLNHSYKITE